MQSDSIRIHSQKTNSQRFKKPLTAADLFTQIPGIHEQGAAGKLIEIVKSATESTCNIRAFTVVTKEETEFIKLWSDYNMLLELIKECKDRLESILLWNEEKLQALKDYFSQPFIDLEDIAIGQEAERRLILSISLIKTFLQP